MQRFSCSNCSLPRTEMCQKWIKRTLRHKEIFIKNKTWESLFLPCPDSKQTVPVIMGFKQQIGNLYEDFKQISLKQKWWPIFSHRGAPWPLLELTRYWGNLTTKKTQTHLYSRTRRYSMKIVVTYIPFRL